jgi:hypothetical protein
MQTTRWVHQLPQDIQMLIISHLDIDSRRALGVYGKLLVTEDLKAKLGNLPKIQKSCWWGGCCVHLGDKVLVSTTPYSVYTISKHYNTYETYTEVTSVSERDRKIIIHGNYYPNEVYQLSAVSSF